MLLLIILWPFRGVEIKEQQNYLVPFNFTWFYIQIVCNHYKKPFGSIIISLGFWVFEYTRIVLGWNKSESLLQLRLYQYGFDILYSINYNDWIRFFVLFLWVIIPSTFYTTLRNCIFPLLLGSYKVYILFRNRRIRFPWNLRF